MKDNNFIDNLVVTELGEIGAGNKELMLDLLEESKEETLFIEQRKDRWERWESLQKFIISYKDASPDEVLFAIKKLTEING